ncbi:dolichol-phosphate mannosyltransferase subunit 3 [Blastocladiella britannica]|nr:dolichol-phosphate mannosyltransferase subunit 3 [Blastocladiella britannica]
MTKLVAFLIQLAVATALWLVLLNDVLPFTLIPLAVVPAIPSWCLVTFGAKSLASIGWSLITFGDCPEAHQEILKEIKQAHEELRRRGVTVD